MRRKEKGNVFVCFFMTWKGRLAFKREGKGNETKRKDYLSYNFILKRSSCCPAFNIYIVVQCLREDAGTWIFYSTCIEIDLAKSIWLLRRIMQLVRMPGTWLSDAGFVFPMNNPLMFRFFTRFTCTKVKRLLFTADGA